MHKSTSLACLELAAYNILNFYLKTQRKCMLSNTVRDIDR